MKFTDPVAAFRNVHGSMKRSGRLAFVCWRSLEENELDIMPLRAAGLEEYTDRTPFSFEQREVLYGTLNSAGFRQVIIEPYDCAVSSGGLDATLQVLLRVGAVGKIVRENPGIRESIQSRLRPALAARVIQDRVSLNAAVWIVTAMA